MLDIKLSVSIAICMFFKRCDFVVHFVCFKECAEYKLVAGKDLNDVRAQLLISIKQFGDISRHEQQTLLYSSPLGHIVLSVVQLNLRFTEMLVHYNVTTTQIELVL